MKLNVERHFDAVEGLKAVNQWVPEEYDIVLNHGDAVVAARMAKFLAEKYPSSLAGREGKFIQAIAFSSDMKGSTWALELNSEE